MYIFLHYVISFICIVTLHHTVYATTPSSSSLHAFIQPTEHMFDWINTFMDTKNPIPYQESVKELHTIITSFHQNLTAKKNEQENQLEHDMRKIIVYQFDKLETMYTILSDKQAQELGSIRLGLKLARVCQIPDLVQELDSSFNVMLKKAQTIDALLAQDLEAFYLHSFRPFYTKWHDKTPLFFLQALRCRLSH